MGVGWFRAVAVMVVILMPFLSSQKTGSNSAGVIAVRRYEVEAWAVEAQLWWRRCLSHCKTYDHEKEGKPGHYGSVLAVLHATVDSVVPVKHVAKQCLQGCRLLDNQR